MSVVLRLWRENRPLVIAAVLACASVAVAPTWCAWRVAKEDIAFTSAGARLQGTLIKPRGAGPFPAVVLTHDAGEEARDGSKYRRRAETFACNGVAAFIYDRRGRGRSEGDADRFLPVEVLAADALAAVEMLRARPDITTDFVGVSGHCHGAWVAPLAATLSDHVAFVAVSGAPVVTPDEQHIYELKTRLENEGETPEQVLDAMTALMKETPEERAHTFDPSRGKHSVEFFQFDPVPIWEQVRVPVYAIWGADDDVVPARKGRRLIGRSMIHAENNDATLEILDGVDHDLRYTSADEFMSEWVLDRALRAGYGVR